MKKTNLYYEKPNYLRIITLFLTIFFVCCTSDPINKEITPTSTTDDAASKPKKNLSGRVADPGTMFDESKFDNVNWLVMREWKKAGTIIPWYGSTPVVQTISATNSAGLQAAINSVSATTGGGQLRLNNGTYTIDATVLMKDNVRIVGNKTGVILKITLRSTSNEAAINFNGSQNAGLDNLTITYDGEGSTPTPNSFTNNYPNYMVTSVYFNNYTKNCWLQGVRIINSGSNVISSWRAQNITIRDCEIDGAFNKGINGSGYVGISGSKYFLLYNNTIKNIRHLGIQKVDCAYNVVYKNTLSVDVNFHDGDAGNNLVEGNTITLAKAHWWNSFEVGDPNQHKGPGPGNIIWANNCYNPDATPTNKFTSSTLYWLTVGDILNFNYYPSDTSYSLAQPFKKPLPPGNTFYPVIP